MGGEDLATAAVDAVARAAVAATAAVGGAAGGMVVDLVRGRLREVARGEETVAEVERTPDAPEARARLREKLAEVLAEDPAFAAYLASVLAPPEPAGPPAVTGGINIDRGGRARGTFVLGNQAVTKIRKGDPGALVAVVAVVLVMALAVYALARLATGDDGASMSNGHRVAVLKDPATVRAVAPDLHAMPTGWTSTRPTSIESGDKACAEMVEKQLCEWITSAARSSFHDPYDQSADFTVLACTSVDDARRLYDWAEQRMGRAGGAKPLAIEALGDQAFAVEFSEGRGEAYARVGTVVVGVQEEGSNGDYEVATLEALARMVAERAQQAQDGDTPSARARQA
ncbi:hypothetical protein ABT097_21525 [Streptomyces sp. NPDC002225]|uniref:hypothetical protein n=1 Tax=unclassified Streptomyces TaxID=2593676 RepID=UPI0033192B9B